MQKGLHAFISGRVQGVFYRANTCKKATELGLTGWVRNLSDGRVEVLAFGLPEQLIQFQEWLWQGPTAAKVTAVEVNEELYQEFSDFVVK